MSALLPQVKTHQPDEFIMKSDRNNITKLMKATPKHDISFYQWLEGFDVFTAVYVEIGHSTSSMKRIVRDLLTYRKNITDMYKAGYD